MATVREHELILTPSNRKRERTIRHHRFNIIGVKEGRESPPPPTQVIEDRNLVCHQIRALLITITMKFKNKTLY